MRWARSEVGAAALGDARRVQRAVVMLAALVAHTAGTVTAAFRTSAERRAAYDFLASAKVTVLALATAIWEACARRCDDFEWVYVPIDGSSLAFADPYKTRGTGAIGALTHAARGFLVMTAIAVSPAGVPLGILGQLFWTRIARRIKDSRDKRAFANKESRYWVVVAEQVIAALKSQAGGCTPWFQFDRGGDIGEVLLHAVAHDWRITVRAAQDRRLAEGAQVRYLWRRLSGRAGLGRYKLVVAGTGSRGGRVGTMSVRACTVTLRLRDRRNKTYRTVTLGAVLAREVNVPRGATGLEWLLLTTAPVTSFAQALAVVQGYVQRWKIELFHHLWKSGRCQVESSHLQHGEGIQKWATMLGSVAMRTMQLTYQARETPDAAASTLLSRDEIDAIILLRRPQKFGVGDDPPLGTTVRWIAEIGGFTNKSKATHPGKVVVGRGLDKIATAVQLLAVLRTPQPEAKEKRRGQR